VVTPRYGNARIALKVRADLDLRFRSNKPGRSALSVMPENKPTTGPMSTQPVRCTETPMISSVGKVTSASQPAKKSARTEAISAEKAKTTRLNSLRKQRQALKQ
jgi:hypothetical protein